MTSFELLQNIKKYFSKNEEFSVFLDGLSKLSQGAAEIENNLSIIARGGNHIQQAAVNLHSHLSTISQITASIVNRPFFKSIEEFQKSIERLKPQEISENELINRISTDVERFATLYDEYLSQRSTSKAATLVITAKKLRNDIDALAEFLIFIQESIDTQDIPGSSESPLEILLPAQLSITDFSNKLLAIQKLYSEICMLLTVSESSYPLRISKIESGSLWARFFGESRVIGMMVSFMGDTASWLFRKYTTEGKIASVPQKVEAIDSLISLTQRLNDAGIDTSEMKDHISKSAVLISKSLEEILTHQPSITVNNQLVSINSEQHKLYLEQRSPRQIASPD